MHIELDRMGTVQSFKELLLNTAAKPEVEGLLVLSCDGNGYTAEQIDAVLRSCPMPLAGGIFPGVIHGREKIETGTLVIGLSRKPSVFVFKDLSNPEADYSSALSDRLGKLDMNDTVFMLVDGFASRISSFINAMFINVGLEINIVGGGAGSLSLERKPCLMTNDGLLDDCAVLTFIHTASTINISHGWTPIKGPFKVTGSKSNVITSMDWMPAFNIYREAIRSHSGQYLTRENFSVLSMSYPLGISRICSEHIVRDPVKMDDEGNLVCVGEVREGSFVEIMHGSSESLIDATREISTAGGSMRITERSLALMVDCISRALFLKNNFDDELRAVTLPDIPMVGMLSFGEIGTKFKESLELYNKTTVLSILEEL